MGNEVHKKEWIPIPLKLKIFVDIAEWIVFVLLILIFLIMLSPLLPTNKLFQTFIVPSGSMEPTVRVGSIAVIKGISPNTLKKGDIIAFTNPEDSKKVILHRINEAIITSGHQSFKTKGDSNKTPDTWTVSESIVKGKMILSFPYLGFIGTQVKTPIGFILLVILPALILVLLQIKRVKEGIEEEVVRRTQKTVSSISNFEKILIFLFVSSSLLITGTGVKYGYARFLSLDKITGVSFSMADFAKPSCNLILERGSKHFRFVLHRIKRYKRFHYVITYDTNGRREGISGTRDIDNQDDFESEDTTLGTCSTGDTCVFDKNIHNIHLQVDLIDSNLHSLSISDSQ
ncbi:signal peptidase I [Candidatus Gottesmanbacteria bacterium RIFCSPHIGHO2_02_FULL_39_11]|uniref:Signal peptidase I n=1 Tax=Candidatus Gottesmanbacteria bacterium RIFCSPHIGHO2_02_FULL_39_11 TaxID=1798382 RepID=A0A1F5ZWI4_9BACT|nr:MAG: signal peptidase I [Candidatus Gottesmanbacteria bacterium RIFCSPHIGHO2_02_FULL_39_11]